MDVANAPPTVAALRRSRKYLSTSWQNGGLHRRACRVWWARWVMARVCTPRCEMKFCWVRRTTQFLTGYSSSFSCCCCCCWLRVTKLAANFERPIPAGEYLHNMSLQTYAGIPQRQLLKNASHWQIQITIWFKSWLNHINMWFVNWFRFYLNFSWFHLRSQEITDLSLV